MKYKHTDKKIRNADKIRRAFQFKTILNPPCFTFEDGIPGHLPGKSFACTTRGYVDNLCLDNFMVVVSRLKTGSRPPSIPKEVPLDGCIHSQLVIICSALRQYFAKKNKPKTYRKSSIKPPPLNKPPSNNPHLTNHLYK